MVELSNRKKVEVVMKVLGRVLIFILILIVVLFTLGFALVYYNTSDIHKPYMDLIEKYSKKNYLDEKLVAAIVKVESSFDPDAHSSADAMGLMQLVPDTAKWVAEKFGEEYDSAKIKEPETNIKYGTYYFKHLLNYYHSIDYAIIAYNGGIGNVDSWIKEGILTGRQDDYENIPFGETRHYLKKVKDQYYLYQEIYDKHIKNDSSSRLSLAFKLYLDFLKKPFVQ